MGLRLKWALHGKKEQESDDQVREARRVINDFWYHTSKQVDKTLTEEENLLERFDREAETPGLLLKQSKRETDEARRNRYAWAAFTRYSNLVGKIMRIIEVRRKIQQYEISLSITGNSARSVVPPAENARKLEELEQKLAELRRQNPELEALRKA